MFAEDIGLLPDEPFRQVLDKVAVADPKEFVPLAGELWHAMDEGKRFLLRKLLRFNGHVFRDAEALPLRREALALLLEAARSDWQHVEPSIFGTLLVRALDPEERHRLGAEFTPRAYVERVVRPAVEEPIRERWTAVQAEVLQLRESGKAKDTAQAEQRLRDFHAWLRGLRFLDPACGSGNFLYVTMHLVKRIELEVIRALEEVTGQREARFEEVGPAQFHGIEIKAAAERDHPGAAGGPARRAGARGEGGQGPLAAARLPDPAVREGRRGAGAGAPRRGEEGEARAQACLARHRRRADRRHQGPARRRVALG